MLIASQDDEELYHLDPTVLERAKLEAEQDARHLDTGYAEQDRKEPGSQAEHVEAAA